MKKIEIELEVTPEVLALAESARNHYQPQVDLFEYMAATLPDLPGGRFSVQRERLGYSKEFMESFDNRWYIVRQRTETTRLPGGISSTQSMPKYGAVSGTGVATFQEHDGTVLHAQDRQAAGLPPLQN